MARVTDGVIDGVCCCGNMVGCGVVCVVVWYDHCVACGGVFVGVCIFFLSSKLCGIGVLYLILVHLLCGVGVDMGYVVSLCLLLLYCVYCVCCVWVVFLFFVGVCGVWRC